MKKSTKGFTLIELLIVVAIIGILAAALLVSLGSARQTARDARRIGDLRGVQAALELYFNKCATYPPGAATSCTVPAVPAANTAYNWADLVTSLTGTGAGLGITKLPHDPQLLDSGESGTQQYRYGLEAGGQRYVLRARLERANAALTDDVDDNPYFAVDCSDTVTNQFYCVGI